MPVLRNKLAQRLTTGAAAPRSEKAKRDRVRSSRGASQIRRNVAKGRLGAFDKAADDALEGDGNGRRSSLSAIRYIGSRTFYKSGDTWYDSEFDAAKRKDLKQVKVGSKLYFELLAKDGGIAKYLALGDVVLQTKGKWYHVTPAKSKKK